MIKYILLSLFLAISISYASTMKQSKQIRVVVLDSGLDLEDPRFKDVLCKTGHKDFTGKGLKDNNRHGTHIAGLIKNYAKGANYCLIIVKYYDNGDTSLLGGKNYDKALPYIISLSPDVVNYSGGGYGFTEEEKALFLKGKDIQWFVAAGNNNEDLKLSEYYPATFGFSNIHVVGALKRDLLTKTYGSNYNFYGMSWEVGEDVESDVPCPEKGHYNCTSRFTGTSQATAIKTGKYLSSLDSNL